MTCKFCQAQLEDGTSVCPDCGRVLTEKPKKVSVAAWLAVALCAVLLVVLVAVVVIGVNRINEDTLETDPSETETTSATQSVSYEASDYLVHLDVTGKASYTVSEDALEAAAGTVVATAGEYTLTSEQLQVFYWMQFSDFMDYYSYYAYYYFGLDDTLPLDTQYLPGTDITWEQYFLDGALTTWYQCAVLGQMAADEGFEMEQEMRDALDTLAQDLEADALESGYASADEMVADAFAPGCTLEAYCYYMESYWTAMCYSEALYTQYQPTADEIKAYFDEHASEYEASGITEDTAPYVDVRHILLMPDASGTDESGTAVSTDEDWAACYSQAQAILDAWLAGEATEDSFADLANTHSADGGSNTTGGLYEMVTDDGTYVEAFTNWCIEDGRQVGDTGIVQTEYGYHIMYCSAIEEAWYLYAQDDIVSEWSYTKLEAAEEKQPFEYDLAKVVLGSIAAEETESTAEAVE